MRSGYPGPEGQPSTPPSGGSAVKAPRDWHAERYAAGEALAKASRELLTRQNPLLQTPDERDWSDRMREALAEYDRTKNAP